MPSQYQYPSSRQILLSLGLCVGLLADMPVAQAAEPPAANAIAQAAVKAGVLACAGRINQVSQFVIGNSPAGAFLFGAPAQPDQHLVSFSFEIKPASGPLAYASASFAPNQANGCGADYEAIVYWPQKCEVVASKQFTGLKKGPFLQKEIMVLESGVPTTRIFLMPAGSGCVSIKKEIVS